MIYQQQSEALRYFKEHATDWQNKALAQGQAKFNVITQRNQYVQAIIGQRPATSLTLDVGCGTGDLVCAIASVGIKAVGVDFAEEMIQLARDTARRAELDNAEFHCCSLFDFDCTARQFDVISANGFIEYISLDDFQRFLALAWQSLAPAGSLVLGSRNRLFNLFSLNAYTTDELNNGAIPALLQEAIALSQVARLDELASLEPAPLQKSSTEHAKTGIDVTTRYQYTPLQLIRLLQTAGFTVSQLYPVHIHGVPPAFKQQQPEVHTSIANLLQNYAGAHGSLIPFASTFMLHAQKTGEQQ